MSDQRPRETDVHGSQGLPGSRLPADPRYWEELATRVSEAAEPTLEALQSGALVVETTTGDVAGGGSLPWRAPLLAAAAALVAVLGTWLATDPPVTNSAAVAATQLERALLPDDPIATVLLVDRTGPSIEQLLRATRVPD